MDTDLLFRNEKEKVATLKVLAFIKVRKLNETIDLYMQDILTYAKEIDETLKSHIR